MLTRTITTLVVAGALVAPAQAGALTKRTAETSVRLAAIQSFAGFTEKKPWIRASCRMDRRFHATCRGRYVGDRLDATFKATVVERVDGYEVRFSRLKP